MVTVGVIENHFACHHHSGVIFVLSIHKSQVTNLGGPALLL